MGITRVVLILDEGFILLVISIQSPSLSSNPQNALSVLVDRGDSIRTQAVRIVGVLLVLDKSPVLPVKPFGCAQDKSIEPIAGSNPKHTGLILINRGDFIMAQTIGGLGIILKGGKSLTIAGKPK